MSGSDESGNPLDPKHPWNTDTRTAEEQRADAMRAKLEKLRHAYHDGNMGALEAAVTLCDDNGLALPIWAVRGIRDSLKRDQFGESTGKRGQKTWVGRYADDLEDLNRYEAVLEARDHGIRWMDAYAAASQTLYGHPDHAHTVEKAYKRVKERLQTEPGRYLVLRNRPG